MEFKTREQHIMGKHKKQQQTKRNVTNDGLISERNMFRSDFNYCFKITIKLSAELANMGLQYNLKSDNY